MKVRVFYSGLTGNIYASRRYSERPGGLFVSHDKDDVTDEAIAAVAEHVGNCERRECICHELGLRRQSQCGRIYPVPEPGEPVKYCTRAPEHVGPHSDGEVRWTYRGLDVELVL